MFMKDMPLIMYIEFIQTLTFYLDIATLLRKVSINKQTKN